jgi:hypothetical protein
MDDQSRFRRRMTGVGLTCLCLALIVGACETGMLESDRPFTVGIELVSGEPRVGQELSFEARATGNQLGLLVIRFGDGAADSLEGMGANEMVRRTEYTYGDPGTYRVQATAITFLGTTLTDELVLEILDADP